MSIDERFDGYVPLSGPFEGRTLTFDSITVPVACKKFDPYMYDANHEMSGLKYESTLS